METIIVWDYLLFAAVYDWQHKEIQSAVTGITFLTGIVFRWITFAETSSQLSFGGFLTTLLIGLLPGLVMMALVPFFKGGLGGGDGLTVLVIGLFLSGIQVLGTLFFASLAAALWGLLLLALKKIKKKQDFPFLPFVLGGYVITRICGI